jgi:enamine deaminase RidA (YjgF/YER057c/UK114 family)
MARRLISTGSPFEKVAGYSRAIVNGDWCFVSGTTGYDYGRMAMPEDVVDQATNCLVTIQKAVTDAGFSLADTVRVTIIVTDVAFADRVFPVLGQYFGEIRPAMTMIVAGLVKPEMKIEIELTAMKG